MKRHDFSFLVGMAAVLTVIVLVLGLSSKARCEAPPIIGPLQPPPAETAPSTPEPPRVAPTTAQLPPDLDFVGTPPTLRERIEVEVAMNYCDRASRRHASPWALLWLVRLAEYAGLPEDMRLWLPSVWCHESAYGWGDVVGDGGNSKGPLQLQAFHIPPCGGVDARLDLRWAAKCWVTRIKQVMAKVERRCSRPSLYTSEAWVSGGRRYMYSCTRTSGHIDRLLLWNRIVGQRLRALRVCTP